MFMIMAVDVPPEDDHGVFTLLPFTPLVVFPGSSVMMRHQFGR